MMVAAEKTQTTTHADDDPPAYYRLESYAAGAWGPAIAGPLNTTSDDDETASTFATVHEALVAFDTITPCPEGVRLVRSDGRVLFTVSLRPRVTP